jgi:hypothetical protein
MEQFTVEFRNRDFEASPVGDLALTARRWSGSRSRGPVDAEVTASGTREAIWSLCEKLGYEIIIKNANGTNCWWGQLVRLEMTYDGEMTGLSLDDMANKIRIRYSYDAPGGNVSGTTEWAEDTQSTTRYGIKTLTENADQTTLAEAEFRRDTMLEYKSLPIGTEGEANSNLAQGMATAKLFCRGWTETLAWQPYEQPQGRLVHDDGGAEQIMGYGFTEALGFKNHVNTIHSVAGNFLNLPEGVRLQLSGMAANNGTFTVDVSTEDEFETYTASTISFESTDDIKDSASGLTFIRTHEMIEIIGSSGQDGYQYTDSGSHNHVTTDTGFGGQISNEAAGASITIDQGNSITVAENVTRAAPAATATVVAHGMGIGQSFTIPESGSFTVGEVVIRARKIGTPTGGIKVSICNDSAGVVGSIIETVIVPAADVGEAMDDIGFNFLNTSTLTFGTTYHIAIAVDGLVNSATGYYMIDVAEAGDDGIAPYTGGTLKLWTGSTWVARVPNASLSFQIWGHQTTTQQIVEVVDAAGQFGLSAVIRTSSTLPKRQYREGKYDALNEFDDLLNAGTSGSKRLIVKPAIGTRTLIIEQEPEPNANEDLMRKGGKLFWPGGAPLEPGVLVYGRWITLANVPLSISRLARISPMFVEKDAYTADTDTHEPDPRGARNVWELGKIKNG